MDKSLAKSKRAHSQHHKKHHPNQKPKGATSSAGISGTNKAPSKEVKEKPRLPRGPAALPSNWDRYEDEDDSITEGQIDSQSSQPSDIVLPKSKGADYAYLISEAKSQKSTRISSDIFPSLDDFISDFGKEKDFFAVRGESLLSSLNNDTFYVDDKTPASYEASFLSLNLHTLSEQLAKIDLPKRLFIEDDLFPPALYSEIGQEHHNSIQDHSNLNNNEVHTHDRLKVASPATTKSHHDQTSSTSLDPPVQSTSISYPKSAARTIKGESKLKPEMAETELDMLLDSFADTSLKENVSNSKITTDAFDIDGTLDDLLNETSTTSMLDQNTVFQSHEITSIPIGSRSELLDDFDSWLDTI
ncbi:protein ECERIFERUM 16 [Rutidosis leptorrhynchoides]|uniref:protein ECERIFERUM 16 n=1 Tax=Rutidosis leptorrhynchoides TaxID=125765 RepID=UPI003A9A5264